MTPKKALTSIKALKPYAGKMIYFASQKFGMGDPIQYTGYGVEYSASGNDEYHYIYDALNDHRMAQVDMHILPNNYNDWYTFGSEQDALDYINGKE